MTTQSTTGHTVPTRDSGRWVIWAAGLIVALGAAVATAHGLYEVAIAATVPAPIAWLYPLITDGLALVAYASTTRLTAGGRRYAWAVVVLAAGLSGLAQASYLAIGVHTAPTELRFGVGAWPAVAAAITAHLLYLLAAVRPEAARSGVVRPDAQRPYDLVRPVRPGQVRATAVRHDTVQPNDAVPESARVRPSDVEQLSDPLPFVGTGGSDNRRQHRDGDLSRTNDPVSRTHPPGTGPADTALGVARPVQPVRPDAVRPDAVRPDEVRPYYSEHLDVGRPVRPEPAQPAPDRPVVQPGQPVVQPPVRTGPPQDDAAADSPGDRARAAALAHLARRGTLPTVSALMELANVGRGTAGLALKQLRETPAVERPGLQIVHSDEETGSNR